MIEMEGNLAKVRANLEEMAMFEAGYEAMWFGLAFFAIMAAAIFFVQHGQLEDQKKVAKAKQDAKNAEARKKADRLVEYEKQRDAA